MIEHMYDDLMPVETTVEPSFEDQLADVAGHLNVLHARWVDISVRADAEGGWQGEGIHSVEHWLTIHMGASPASAKQVARIAARIDGFPLLRDAFGRGELSIDQVDEVVTKAPEWADAKMTDFAKECTVRQLRRMIRDEHFEGEPDEPEPATKPDRDRVSFRWDEHGRFGLHADLDAATGSLVEAAINEARDSLFQAGDENVTWSDALAEICGRSLAAAPLDRRERFKTYLHLHTDRGATQLTNGVPLPDSVRDYLLCDGLVQPVWERDNTPVGVGRTQRIVPDRLRRLVEHRDQGCRVPGCGAKHVEIHHIIHWTDGEGPTESWNLMSCCPRHHKQHHTGLFGVSGNADLPTGLVFTDANGRVLDEYGKPKVPTGPPPEPDVRYEHPSGGRMDGRWIDWTHPKAVERRHRRARESSERAGEAARAAQLRAAQEWYDQNTP